MARDTGSYTTSNLPVTDPLHTLVVSTASANNTTTLSYTTTGAHNLKVGSPVVIFGTGNASFNFNPDTQKYGAAAPSATLLGWGNPAVVSAVTGTNTFTVKAPTVVATASVATGTVVNDILDSNAPWDKTWLPTNAITNVVVAREWGNSFPIQNNEDRAANVAITGVSANGNQVTFTVGSGHGLVAGQRVSIQGIKSGSYNSNAYNFENVIASTTSTTVVFNSTLTDAVTSYTNGAIIAQATIGGAKVISSAVGAVAVTTALTSTTTATAAAAATSLAITSTSSLAVGMGVSASAGISSGTVITAIGSGTVTINPAVNADTVASAAVITFSASTSNQYVTQQAHGLVSGENITITGASNPNYNVSGVATVVNAKTFSVKAPVFKIKSVSGTSGSGTVGDGTNVLYTTENAHGLVSGDKVAITGMAPSGYNTANSTVISDGLSANAFAIANVTTTAVTAFGQLVENSGTFSGTASIAGDKSWASTYAYPSGNLDPSLDDHDRVTNSERGYPDFTPSYTVPEVRGLTTTNAIQKLRAAGQSANILFSVNTTVSTSTSVSSNSTTVTVASTAGVYVGMGVTGTAAVTAAIAATNYVASIGTGTITLNATTTNTVSTSVPLVFTTDIFGATIATAASTITVTALAAHYLSPGDTVNLSGTANAALNAGDVIVTSVPSSTTFVLPIAGIASNTATGLVIRPKNTVVTAQTPAAGATTSTVVRLARNYGI